MSILDLLYTQENAGGVGAPDERDHFTVNNAVLDVTLNAIAVPQHLRNVSYPVNPSGLGFRWFSPKDNILLLSAGVVFPYNYTLSTKGIGVQFFWQEDVTAAIQPIQEIGGSGSFGQIYIPSENFELSLNIFCKAPGPPFTRRAAIAIQLLVAPALNAETRISMVGSPAVLDGLTLPVVTFAKVLHTLPLVAD